MFKFTVVKEAVKCWALTYQNTAMLVKINFARHQHDTERTQRQSRIVAIGSCFAIIAALQYGVTTRESSVEKKPRTLIYHRDLELTEDRIMPYHVSPWEQEAKCQVDVSQRKYNGVLASRKELTNRVEELLM